MEEILPVEIMQCRDHEDIYIDSDEEDRMEEMIRKSRERKRRGKRRRRSDLISRSSSSTTKSNEERELEDLSQKEKVAMSIVFDDDTQSVSTDYEEGLAAFSGEYLDGLDEEDKYFWRKL